MTKLAREYGEGLYALAVEEKTEEAWLGDLATLLAVFREQPDYLRLLGNMALPREERLALLDQTFRGRLHPYLLNFLKLLCERGVLGDFSGCEQTYRELYNEAHKVVEAVVTTGVALTDDQRSRLLKKLRDMTGERVNITEKVDPAVLGGVVLEMNGRRYDNSVATRLETMRRVISGRE